MCRKRLHIDDTLPMTVCTVSQTAGRFLRVQRLIICMTQAGVPEFTGAQLSKACRVASSKRVLASSGADWKTKICLLLDEATQGL